MDAILGIDLGTTNSVVSVIRDGRVQVLEEDGSSLLPSVVGLDSDGKLRVGEAARNQWVLAPDRTVRSVKRKMGSEEKVQLGDQQYTPQEISAMILRTLKERAVRQLGADVQRAVITVPAFFNEQQREATREAGKLAGLDVVRVINEPTAASLAFKTEQEDLQRLVVYDLGGGTFDVSIVQIEQGVVEVLSSHGDTMLGGDDFDELLFAHVCDAFADQHGLDLRESVSSKLRVLRAVEEAKKELSFDAFVTLEEEFIAEKDGVPLHLRMEISRLEYEQLIDTLLSKTLVCVDEALSDAGLTAGQIDRVILVGVPTRTPLVRQLLSDQLGQPIHSDVDPDLCVAMGAAIQGGLIDGLDVGPVLVDITPHTLGVGCVGQLFGFQSEFAFAPIIHRNTPLPATRSDVFSTMCDQQERVQIEVFQGENADIRQNSPVGEFNLEGLAEVDAGNEILVRFDLDLDGILKVTATEKATGLERALTIDNAISRFARLDHQDAANRIEEVFQSTELQPSGEVPAQQRPEADAPEIAEAIAEATSVLAKSEDLAGGAAQEDAAEIQQLASELRTAINSKSLEKTRAITAKLDDLLFYLQDA